MSIAQRIQDAMKEAMKTKAQTRLECLRLAKGALLVKEKETGKEPSDEESIAVLRAEVKKRQQSMEVYRGLGRDAEVAAVENEIAVLEEFLPQQLSAEVLEARIRAFLGEHPELNHPGKLTGAMKKELGDLADGKMLNELCKKVLEG